MIILRLWFHLSDTGARNGLGPRLGFVTLDEDFFMHLDGVHHRRVVPVPHQAPDLLERKIQLRAEAVAGLVAKADEARLPFLAAEGRDGHVVLFRHLHEDLAGGRLGGRRRGRRGLDGNWRWAVERVRVRPLQAHERANVYGRLLDWRIVQPGADGLVVCVKFFKRHHFVPPVR